MRRAVREANYVHTTYVHSRPKLEHAATVWSPHLRCLELLKRVQRNVTKTKKENEWNELRREEEIVDLLSLEERRLRRNMITIYKVPGGHDEISMKQF